MQVHCCSMLFKVSNIKYTILQALKVKILSYKLSKIRHMEKGPVQTDPFTSWSELENNGKQMFVLLKGDINSKQSLVIKC